MAHPKGLIQGSIYMCDIPDAKSNCVGIYTGILKGKLLCIPCYPMQRARLACNRRGILLQFNTCRGSTSNVYHNRVHFCDTLCSRQSRKTNAAARVAMYLARSPEPF